MIPNFTGCSEYNPPHDPLKGLTAIEIDDFIFAYMKMWYDTERYTDFNAFYDAGHGDQCADWLVSAGAVQSDICYSHCKQIEKIIEMWARQFRKLTDKNRRKQVDAALKGFTVYACNDCNLVQFVDLESACQTDADFKKCWECSSENITSRKWDKS